MELIYCDIGGVGAKPTRIMCRVSTTKVVIDAKGRVRYRAIGYNGNPETTVNELTLVVEMLKEGM